MIFREKIILKVKKRVINELKAINKPFIILLNSIDPTADETIRLSNEMTAEYKVPVIPVSCMELDETEIKRILAQLLFEFPIREIKVDIPKWVVKLDKDHWLKSVVFDSIKKNAAKIEKIRQIQQIISDIEQCEYITSAKVTSLDLGKGYAEMAVSIESELFYKVISEETGLDITEEYELLNCIKDSFAKTKKNSTRLHRLMNRFRKQATELLCRQLTNLPLTNRRLLSRAENTVSS